jgi:predicted RNase H-related nuclease YkuK (DUF458 family)
MSISLSRGNIDRLNRDIAGLRSKVAAEAAKEAEATAKINRAVEKARRTTNPSMHKSAIGEVQRAQKDLERATKSRAQHEKAIATKTTDLLRHQASLSRAEEAERKKQEQNSRRVEQDREKRIRDLESQLLQQRAAAVEDMGRLPPPREALPECDCFISHASEDKEGFVRALAAALQKPGLTLFYDEISIAWGDSLRRRIDEGLARSKFGVVVLSEAFFRKEWPQRELDGLVQMEMVGRSKILPIWHKVSKDEVAAFSPMLADKVALNTSDFTAEEIAEKLAELSR